MYTSFNDIFLEPAYASIDWDNDDIITNKGRFIKLTKHILEKIVNMPRPRSHRYKVMLKSDGYHGMYMPYRYDYLYTGTNGCIKTHAGLEVTIQEFLDHKFGYPDMWICDVSRVAELFDGFTELRSGLKNEKALGCRMDILYPLSALMLTYDADVATNGSLVNIHDRTIEWLDKLGELERYDRYKRLYARMRAKSIVCLRRLMAPDTARMIVAMAYPWH